MPTKKIGDSVAPPSTRKPSEGPTEGNLSPPIPLPTYAQAAAHLTPDEEGGPIRWTQQEERELMADGIWPEREWQKWRQAMTRGIIAE